jgi:hypothetical protein
VASGNTRSCAASRNPRWFPVSWPPDTDDLPDEARSMDLFQTVAVIVGLTAAFSYLNASHR